MVTDRITVSIDEEARTALDNLTERTGRGQSELVRDALTFYAANFRAAETDASVDLQAYHAMLSNGESVFLDVDLLHCLVEYIDPENAAADDEFMERFDRVARYHAAEYEDKFDDLGELLDWVEVCGFVTVRYADHDTYHVVFPTERIRWIMTRFITESATHLPFEIDVEPGVSKVLMTERPAGAE